jgi:hypothetical protein
VTQSESLVSQAHVGLGGVAGGGLTHWADSDRLFVLGSPSSHSSYVMFRLGPVRATTLGGAFSLACESGASGLAAGGYGCRLYSRSRPPEPRPSALVSAPPSASDGAFHCVSHRTDVGVAASYRPTYD